MRTKFLLSLALLLGALGAWAQTQVAALTHNGQVKLYYGADAFATAANQAANGDVINLSAGTFNGATIEKRITVRGAGMLPDEANAAEATIISGVVKLTSYASLEDGRFTQFEGIDFAADGAVAASGADVSGVVFTKCRLRNVYRYVTTSSQDYYFNDCHFYGCHVLGSSFNFNFKESTFNNCYCSLWNNLNLQSGAGNTFDLSFASSTCLF